MLYRKTAQAKKISERSEWKTENSLLIASAEQTRLALEAAQEEKKILEGFIQDAKKEIATLTEEKAQKLARELKALKEAQEALDASKAQLEALKNEKEAILQENGGLKARKLYQMIFKNR